MLLLQTEIPRRARLCSIGQEPFSAGMEYYSVLIGKGEGVYERYDCCLSCWEKAGQQQYIPQAHSSWKSKVPAKSEQPASQNIHERALELLKASLESGVEFEAPHRYLLAIYLARKRVILLRDNIEDTQLYEVASTEEMLQIKVIDLTKIDVDQVQKEIDAKFKPIAERSA